MNGLPKRELISSYANGMLDDGDDLHITCSFDEENEENSSTLANASDCMSSSRHNPRSRRPGNIPVHVGLEKERKATVTVDTVPNNREKGDNVSSSNKKSLKVVKILRRLFPVIRFRPPPMVFRSSMSSTTHQYQEMVEDDEHEHEHEHAEEKQDSHADDDSSSNSSRRSTRNNVRTGRTMLVRQKAKVFSSPSNVTAAPATCDSAASFSFDSTSYRNILPRQRSLTLDHSSCDDGLSDITDDNTPSFYLSFRRRQMFIDENTTCIQEDGGEDDDDDDDDDDDTSESNSKSERNGGSVDSTSMECGYDFRTLLSFDENKNKEPTVDNNYITSDQTLDNNYKEVTPAPTESWQRKITDAHGAFENDYFGTDILLSTTDSLFTTNQEPFQQMKSSSRSSSSPSNSHIGDSDNSLDSCTTPPTSTAFPRFPLDNDSWPESESRDRTDSDSCSHDSTLPNNQTVEESPVWGDLDQKKKLVGPNKSLLDTAEFEFVPSVMTRSNRDNRLSLDAHSELLLSHRQPWHIFGLEEQNHRQHPTRSKTHSDSIVVRGKSFPGARAWDFWDDSRNHSLLDFDNDETPPTAITEGLLLGTSSELLGSSPIASASASHARHLTTTTTTTLLLSKKRRSSSTKKVENTATTTTTTASHVTGSAVLATLSPTTNTTTGELLSANNRVMPLQYSSAGRQPSPRTLNVATMSVTTLRPAPAPTQPMLPKPSCIVVGQSDNYYWKQGSGNVEMCEIQKPQPGRPIPIPALTQTQLMLPQPLCSTEQNDNSYWNQGAGNVELCEIQEPQPGIPIPRTWSTESFDDLFFQQSKAREHTIG